MHVYYTPKVEGFRGEGLSLLKQNTTTVTSSRGCRRCGGRTHGILPEAWSRLWGVSRDACSRGRAPTAWAEAKSRHLEHRQMPFQRQSVVGTLRREGGWDTNNNASLLYYVFFVCTSSAAPLLGYDLSTLKTLSPNLLKYYQSFSKNNPIMGQFWAKYFISRKYMLGVFFFAWHQSVHHPLSRTSTMMPTTASWPPPFGWYDLQPTTTFTLGTEEACILCTVGIVAISFFL